MNDRPTRDDLTLTPNECVLCFVYAVLWICGVALAAIRPQDSVAFVRDMARWMSQQIGPLWKAELPAFSMDNLLQLIATCFVIGAAILGPFHFAYLARFGRWLRPATLWFWTMLHSLLPVLFVLVVGSMRLSETGPGRLPGSKAEDAVIFGIILVIPISIFVASLRLWRRRKSAGAG